MIDLVFGIKVVYVKKITAKDKTLLRDLDNLIEPSTIKCPPKTPLRLSSKSTTKLAEELKKQGHSVDQKTIYRILKDQEYSMKSNRKRLEGAAKQIQIEMHNLG